jgi:hypothetical protein
MPNADFVHRREPAAPSALAGVAARHRNPPPARPSGFVSDLGLVLLGTNG